MGQARCDIGAGELARAPVSGRWRTGSVRRAKQPRMVRTEGAAGGGAGSGSARAACTGGAGWRCSRLAQQPEATTTIGAGAAEVGALVAASDVAGVLRLVERRQQSGQADPIALVLAGAAGAGAAAGARRSRHSLLRGAS